MRWLKHSVPPYHMFVCHSFPGSELHGRTWWVPLSVPSICLFCCNLVALFACMRMCPVSRCVLLYIIAAIFFSSQAHPPNCCLKFVCKKNNVAFECDEYASFVILSTVIFILITLTKFNFLLGFVIDSVIKFLLNVTYHEIYWIHYLYVPNRVPNFCTGLYLLLFLHFLSFDFTMTSTLPLQRLQRWFIHWGTWLPTPAASSTWSCSPPVARQYHLRGKRRKRFGKASSLFRLPLSALSTGTTLRMT